MNGAADVGRRLAQVWNGRDPEAVEALFHPEAEFRDMAFDVEKRGLDDIRGMFRETWRGIPDLHSELHRVVADGAWVALEWTLTGTHHGDFPDLPATGRSVSLPGMSLLELRDGRIARQRDYYDRAAFLEQLGLAPGGS